MLHPVPNKLLLPFWKGKKTPAGKLEFDRLEKVIALAFAQDARVGKRKVQELDAAMETVIGTASSPAAAAAAAATACAQCPRPALSSCAAPYDAAHAAMPRAACLVLDTETSHFSGCVLDIGWILADRGGNELASHSQLWHLPAGERIHSGAFRAHKISSAMLRANGVDPKDGELAEFYALAFAAIAAGVILVAHNASFDVGRLNSTALKHKLKLPPLCSAPPAMLCTMNSAAQHCRLRKKGDKA